MRGYAEVEEPQVNQVTNAALSPVAPLFTVSSCVQADATTDEAAIRPAFFVPSVRLKRDAALAAADKEAAAAKEAAAKAACVSDATQVQADLQGPSPQVNQDKLMPTLPPVPQAVAPLFSLSSCVQVQADAAKEAEALRKDQESAGVQAQGPSRCLASQDVPELRVSNNNSFKRVYSNN